MPTETVAYLASSVERGYSETALNWIGSTGPGGQKQNILDVAAALGVSAAAIAGAMAEEYDAYLASSTANHVLDWYELGEFGAMGAYGHELIQEDYSLNRDEVDNQHSLLEKDKLRRSL